MWVGLLLDLAGWVVAWQADEVKFMFVGLVLVASSVVVAQVMTAAAEAKLADFGGADPNSLTVGEVVAQVSLVSQARSQRNGNLVSMAILAGWIGWVMYHAPAPASAVVAPDKAPAPSLGPASAESKQAEPPEARQGEAANDIPAALRADYRLVLANPACAAGATLTMTRSHAMVTGCRDPSANVSMRVTRVERDLPLYILHSDGREQLLLRLGDDGGVTIVQPVRWAGAWSR